MTWGACSVLTPGQRVDGRYRVEREIGKGGMGAVYAARDPSGAPCALKILLDGDHPTLRKRFLREARAAARLSSEHATRVLDAGELADGTPYLVMELLVGRDLCDVLREDGPLAVADAIDFTLQAAEALGEAHRLGMVHRDIKPANLFLTTRADGSRCVKLLDFGLSKPALATLAPMTQLTQQGSMLGSPEYMSPEQLVSSADVDARADVWSLGATLHELLTGSPAFAGDTLTDVATSILREPPRPIDAVRPDVPPALVAVVKRCLEKDAELRFGSMDDLADALRRAAPSHLSVPPPFVGSNAAWGERDATRGSPSMALGPTLFGEQEAQPGPPGVPSPSAVTQAAAVTQPGAYAPSVSANTHAQPGAYAPSVSANTHAQPRAYAPSVSANTHAQPGAYAPSVSANTHAQPGAYAPTASPPRRSNAWRWVAVAFVALSVVVGGGVAVLGALLAARSERADASAEDDDDAPQRKRGKQRGDEALTLLEGDLEVPARERVELRRMIERAEAALARGEPEAVDEPMLAVVARATAHDVQPGGEPSALVCRAHELRAKAFIAQLDQVSATAETLDDRNRVHHLTSEAFRAAIQASLYHREAPSCPLELAVRGYVRGAELLGTPRATDTPHAVYDRTYFALTLAEAAVQVRESVTFRRPTRACLRKIDATHEEATALATLLRQRMPAPP